MWKQGLGMAAGLMVLAGCQNGEMHRPLMGSASGMHDEGKASSIVARWPQESKMAAETMIQKYGEPGEATETALMWHKNGPWKRTTVSRDPVDHAFPMAHKDVLEQVIDYRVPPEAFDDLAMYDGSVIVERTKGELSARCDKEEMNFLALNLAHDIVEKRRDVEDARAFYAKTAMDFKQGKKNEYVQGLMFRPMGRAGDPDQPFKGMGGQ
jgi:hypothetical protein